MQAGGHAAAFDALVAPNAGGLHPVASRPPALTFGAALGGVPASVRLPALARHARRQHIGEGLSLRHRPGHHYDVGGRQRLVGRPVIGCVAVRCYDETIWIAQKSLAKCAPLMGEPSELALDPVRYAYGM